MLPIILCVLPERARRLPKPGCVLRLDLLLEYPEVLRGRVLLWDGSNLLRLDMLHPCPDVLQLGLRPPRLYVLRHGGLRSWQQVLREHIVLPVKLYVLRDLSLQSNPKVLLGQVLRQEPVRNLSLLIGPSRMARLVPVARSRTRMGGGAT
jgi:hypothetical protein